MLIMATFCVSGCAAQKPDTATNAAAGETTATAMKPEKKEENAVPVNFDLENDVLYFGRTYKKSNIRWFNWSGAGFSIRFRGSAVAAEFYSNVPDTRNLAYLKVYVDGVEQEDILLSKDNEIIMLAEGLDAEQEHTIQVRKRTNARSSTAGVGRLVLMDGTILPPEAPKERLIEFIGDSLTVGYVAAKDGKMAAAWSTTTEDVTKTYCPQIARAFDAEYQVVAISGRGVVRNNGGDSEVLFPDIYPELDYYNNPGVKYDFSVQPDVIVVNLGTNDESDANKDLPREEFRQGLYAFLTQLRQYYPNAQILYTYGLVRVGLSEDIAAVVDQLRSEGDDNIHYLQLAQCESWELNLNHTVSTAYTARGDEIIEKIREITGW